MYEGALPLNALKIINNTCIFDSMRGVIGSQFKSIKGGVM
jgi:hypothetical protein